MKDIKTNTKIISITLLIIIAIFGFSSCKSSDGANSFKRKSFKGGYKKEIKKSKSNSKSSLSDEESEFKAKLKSSTGHSYSDREVKKIFKIYKKHKLTTKQKVAVEQAEASGGMIKKGDKRHYKKGKKKRAKLKKKMDKYTRNTADKKAKKYKKKQIRAGSK